MFFFPDDFGMVLAQKCQGRLVIPQPDEVLVKPQMNRMQFSLQADDQACS